MTQLDGSLEVNGSGDYIRRTTDLPSSTAFTMAGWFKPATLLDQYKFVAFLGANTGTAGIGSAARAGSPYGATSVYSSAYGGFGSSYTISADTWYYISTSGAGTGSTDAVCRIWDSSGSLLLTSELQGVSVTVEVMVIGNSPYQSYANEWFNGKYSYWRTWGAALSRSELEAEMFSRTPVRTSNLDSALNNADGADESGNGRNWTLNSITASGDYPDVFPDEQVPTGTSGGLVVGSHTSFVGEGFVGSIEAAGSISSAASVSLPLPTASGAGQRGLKATGEPSLPLLTASGTGTKARKGSGTPGLPLLTGSGAGQRSLKATGAATLPLPTASGSGTVGSEVVWSGSGATSLPLVTASGAASRALKAPGAAPLPLVTASGAGTKSRKGSGAATLPAATGAGSGAKARKGSGSPSLPLATASGAASRGLKSTGAPSLPLATASGSGSSVAPGVFAGSGAATLPALVASGTGTLIATAAATGGWATHFRREQEALRRQYLRELAEEAEEEAEREELAERLEATLIADGTATQYDVDRLRLAQLAAQYSDRALLDRRAQRALAYAERARSELATRLALRELIRQQEDEELALVLALAAD